MRLYSATSWFMVILWCHYGARLTFYDMLEVWRKRKLCGAVYRGLGVIAKKDDEDDDATAAPAALRHICRVTFPKVKDFGFCDHPEEIASNEHLRNEIAENYDRSE